MGSINWHNTPHWVKTRLRHMQLGVGQTVTLHGRHFDYLVRVVSEQQGHINQVYDVQRQTSHHDHVQHRHHRGYRLGLTALVVIVIVALVLGFWLGRH